MLLQYALSSFHAFVFSFLFFFSVLFLDLFSSLMYKSFRIFCIHTNIIPQFKDNLWIVSGYDWFIFKVSIKEVIKTFEFSCRISAMAMVPHNACVWAGTDKGAIHVFDCVTMEKSAAELSCHSQKVYRKLCVCALKYICVCVCMYM